MTGTPRPFRLTTAALIATALAVAPAWGQNQVQGGGAHDANQRVGSGGYNQPANQVDYRTRNLLITGDVGGGRAFQDTVDYTSPGAFRGTLGSDSLFNFRRDSVYSTPGAAGLNVRGLGDRVIVTRPSDAFVGYGNGAGYALSTRSQYDPSSGTVSFRQPGGGLVAISGIKDITQLSSATNSLGIVQTPQGLVRIDASPLIGIRYNPLDANTGGSLNPLDGRLPDNPFDIDTDAPDPRDLSPERRIDGQVNPTEDESENPFGLIEDPLSISLGTQVQSAFALQLAGREDNNIPNAQAQAIRGQLFGQVDQNQADQPPKAQENPYDKLIADILAQAKGIETETDNGDEPVEDNRPRWQQILDKPDDAVLDEKRKAREVAIRLSLNMIDDQGNIDFDTPLPTIDPKSELGKLLSDLDYDLPRLDTLAGSDDNRINGLMSRGEKELKAGRYTVSESIYRQVLREKGDDPLAKAGLIHSQMGAGMIRSSAFNLRGLFSDHPELIALRYDSKLLPDTERLRWLQGRLQKQISDESPGSEPGLILAYLGYQLEAKPLIEFGLSVAESEAPRDPLMPVLRRIWLEAEDK